MNGSCWRGWLCCGGFGELPQFRMRLRWGRPIRNISEIYPTECRVEWALRWDSGSGSEHAFRTQRATGLRAGLPSLLTNVGRVRGRVGVESSTVNPPGNRRTYNKVFRACDFSAVSVCDGLFSGSEPDGTASFPGDGGDGS